MNKEQIIKEYRKQRQKEGKKIFEGFLFMLNYLLWLVIAGANFIFIGILYMAFYQTGALEVLKIWLLPLIMAGLASFLLAFHFAQEVGKK